MLKYLDTYFIFGSRYVFTSDIVQGLATPGATMPLNQQELTHYSSYTRFGKPL